MTTNNALVLQGLNDLLDAIPLGERFSATNKQGNRKKGKSLPKLTVALPGDLIEALRGYCQGAGEVQGHIVERALRLYLLIRQNRPSGEALVQSAGGFAPGALPPEIVPPPEVREAKEKYLQSKWLDDQRPGEFKPEW